MLVGCNLLYIPQFGLVFTNISDAITYGKDLRNVVRLHSRVIFIILTQLFTKFFVDSLYYETLRIPLQVKNLHYETAVA